MSFLVSYKCHVSPTQYFSIPLALFNTIQTIFLFIPFTSYGSFTLRNPHCFFFYINYHPQTLHGFFSYSSWNISFRLYFHFPVSYFTPYSYDFITLVFCFPKYKLLPRPSFCIFSFPSFLLWLRPWSHSLQHLQSSLLIIFPFQTLLRFT